MTISYSEVLKHHELQVPMELKHYELAQNFYNDNIYIPKWITIDNIIYNKLEYFPNTRKSIYPGTLSCVVAYMSKNNDKNSHLPKYIALKCRLKDKSKNGQSEMWMKEWKINQYLYNYHIDLHDKVVIFISGTSKKFSFLSQVFFAMTLMDSDLFNVIENNAGNSQWDTWILLSLLKTCQALDAVHQTGIIYSDLKPENVLVKLDTGHCKLVDFDHSYVPKLGIHTIGGTNGYLSPQRIKNNNVCSIHDDIWALGVLILICSTKVASPYRNLPLSHFHKFKPSQFFNENCCMNWPDQTKYSIGILCNNLLSIDPKARPNLRVVAKTLQNLIIFTAYQEMTEKHIFSNMNQLLTSDNEKLNQICLQQEMCRCNHCVWKVRCQYIKNNNYCHWDDSFRFDNFLLKKKAYPIVNISGGIFRFNPSKVFVSVFT